MNHMDLLCIGYKYMMRFCVYVFYFFPINKKKIVFIRDYGTGYGDSPKYLCEKINKKGLPYKMVWLLQHLRYKMPKYIIKTHKYRISSIFELSTAKIIITTSKPKLNFKKKKNQFLIYIPHGQQGPKYAEKRVEDKISSYAENSKWHSKHADLFISSCHLLTQEMRESYWYDGEIQETGLPRNDLFFNFTTEDTRRIRKNLGISDDVKIAIYAPTFRDNGDTSAYAIDAQMVISEFERRTNEKWIILIRLHQNVIWFKKPHFSFSDSIIDVSDYPDMHELLIISDIMINDYSNTMFDFCLMRRPVILFTKDIEEYRQMRGLFDWFEKEVPFPFCYNNEDLKKAIIQFDEIEYRKKLLKFQQFYGSVEKGCSTDILLDRINSIIQS